MLYISLNGSQDLTAENITYFETKGRTGRKTLLDACSDMSPAVLQAEGSITRSSSPDKGTPKQHRVSSSVLTTAFQLNSYTTIGLA